MDHVESQYIPLTGTRKAERFTNSARTAIASGQEGAADGFSDSGGRAAKDRSHPFGILRQALESPPKPEVDEWARFEDVTQRRLEYYLAQPHVGFERLRSIVSCANVVAPFMNVGVVESRELPFRQPRNPGDIHAMVSRDRNVANLVGYPQAPEVLHAASVRDIHLRVSRGCWIALHDECADVPLLQRERRGEPDRPPSDDEHRYIYHSPSLPRIPVESHWSRPMPN